LVSLTNVVVTMKKIRSKKTTSIRGTNSSVTSGFERSLFIVKS
jgi:hypothetical protein